MIDLTRVGWNFRHRRNMWMLGWRWPRLGLILTLSGGRCGDRHAGVMGHYSKAALDNGPTVRVWQLDGTLVWVWGRAEFMVLTGRQLSIAELPASDLTESEVAVTLDAGLIDLD